MILTPSFEDIVNNFIESIRATIPELSTAPTSVIREALINPAASQLSFMFDLSKRISGLQDIFSASGGDLDALAQSYGLSRKSGSTATGILYLDLSQLNTRSSIAVSSGAIVRASGSSSTIFSVVGSFNFSSTDRSAFEASAAGIRSQLDSVGLTKVKMAASVPIQASSLGTQGNIGAFTLTNANIPGVTTVINVSPTGGGTGSESDNSLRARLVALFTGNSVGTATSLLAAAKTPASITGGFLVRFGDPLMTRDGSIYDKSGALITPGTGRAVDIYVQGTSLSTRVEKPTLEIVDKDNFLSLANSVLIGQAVSTDSFGFLPSISTNNVTGAESGATFSQGVSAIDDEGNIIIEGNFALIKDIDASKYSIVENLITKERKLATFLNPSSTRYTILETFLSSDLANSTFSQDRILFLKSKVDVADELLSRGRFNGADQLRFSNVASINETFEELPITETILIENFTEVAGGISIKLKHAPVVSISTVSHTRLGVNIDFELLDTATGVVKFIGRVPPRQGDLLRVEYTWKKIYQEKLNFNLTGDLLDWVSPSDEKNRADSTILPEIEVSAENTLAIQPNIPSYLEFTASNIGDRETIETTLTGVVTNIASDQLALKAASPFTFTVTGNSSIGRIFQVSNVTKGIKYNTIGYKLKTNKLDSKAGVNTQLLSQQFSLSLSANQELVKPGDRIVLGKPSRSLSWSSQADFENNIEENLSPIYDPTKIDFTAGGLVLKTPLLDTTAAVTTLSGSITQNTILSGVIEIIDDLLINEGVVVDIEPNTVIKIRPSEQLVNQSLFAQRVVFDGYLQQQDTAGVKDAYSDTYSVPLLVQFDEYSYIYFKPATFNSNFFTIINDLGQTLSIRFDADILVKTISNDAVIFYVNGRRVDSSFNFDLETTIDLLSTNSSIKATLLGARSGQDGLPKFTSAKIPAINKHYILLERFPVTTNSSQNDFTLAAEFDASLTFQRFSYNTTINALIVDGNILVIDGYGDATTATNYILSHFVEDRSRIAIVVDGTLRILGTTTQTSVLFTSSASSSKVGDWEGIIFTPKSHSSNPRTLFKSDLKNARVMFANVGVAVRASDVNIQNCIIRDCLDTGINVSSSSLSVSQYTNDAFNLTEIGNPFIKFSSTSRLGFLAADNLQIARYPIPANMVTSSNTLPTLGLKLSSTSYVVDLIEGRDYTVFIEFQRALSIDTTLPADGYADHSLTAGKDFVLEFDINTGYSLVFLYTASTSKLRGVYNLISDLSTTMRQGKITIDYYTTTPNGVIFDNMILNVPNGIVLTSLATLSINKNTINNTRLGVVSTQSIVSIRNNLITDYSVTPISTDSVSLVRAQRNDMFSQKIVNQEQTGLSDSDVLLRTTTAFNSTLFVRTPNKFKVGSVIKIDDEEMLVQGVSPDSITVARGQSNTSFAIHQSGSRVSIFQLNQLFTVSGINGDYCLLIETDFSGAPATNATPIHMRLISPNTFRAAFPTNRRADFFYKFKYGFRSSLVTKETLVKVFPKNQFGIGVNDVVSTLHEIPLNSVVFTPNNENYSTDPLYTKASSADFSYSPISSPASRQNPIYGSLIEANPLHKYVGIIDVQVIRNLGVGETRIPVSFDPLIITSYNEINIVGVDILNAGVVLTTNQFTYSITTAEANQGALGVFILDASAHLSGVVSSGNYKINYIRPTDLGTSIPPYYLETDISYVVDIKADVTFDTLTFTKDSLGGIAEFTLQIADSISNLPSASISTAASTSPIVIDQIASTNIGKAIQINVKLKGNDSSFTPDLVLLFPVLQDFTLSYLPTKDTQEYKVLSLIKNTAQNETNILIDRPISSATFAAVGSAQELDLFVRKKKDNFDPSSEFVIAAAHAVTVGDTFIIADGDLIVSRLDASPTDQIRVKFLSFESGSETLHFTQDGSEITKNIYNEVSKIENVIKRDRVIVLPTTQKLTARDLTQPSSGADYKTSYSFEAPLAGESLTVSFTYNQAIRDSSEQVESKKSLFTDVLVKQVITIPVRIAIALEVEPGAPAASIQSQVSTAIANLFSVTLADVEAERRLDESDIIRATGNISGISTISVTTLSRNLITGEIVSPLTFVRRESPILEEGSPRINTSQNGKAVQPTGANNL